MWWGIPLCVCCEGNTAYYEPDMMEIPSLVVSVWVPGRGGEVPLSYECGRGNTPSS